MLAGARVRVFHDHPGVAVESRSVSNGRRRMSRVEIGMSPSKSVGLAVCLTWFALAASTLAGDAARFVGDWKGTLDAGPRKLVLIFHLAVDVDDEDELEGSLDSPDEGLFDLPISGISVAEGGAISIRLAVVGAVYDAKLAADGKTLDGEWKQRGATLPLDCTATVPEAVARVKGQERLAGTFEGRLAVGGSSLRLAFKVREDEKGRLVGTMDSPDQGALGIPITRVEYAEDGTVAFRLAQLSAAFEGKLDGAGNALAGEWKQGGGAFPFELARVDAVSEVRRPQLPKAPFPYRAENVTYSNDAEKLTLSGTLTIPPGDGPFPAAILISGSGPQDRDETILGHKPFLVIADALSRHGVAVLRVDDRGVGESTGSAATATSADLAGDVTCGVEFLKKRPEIDAARIGLIGHSEGGIIGPLVATRRSDIAFVVMLAGPGVNGERILYTQSELLAKAAGTSDEAIAKDRAQNEKLFAIARDGGLSLEEAAKRMREVMLASLDDEERKAAESGAQIEQAIAQVNSPWMRFFLVHDPAPVLAKLKCPTLALIGAKDLQVPAQENAAAIGKAFDAARAAGNENVRIEVVPGLNHLFQPCETGGVGEYAEIETTFDEKTLARIVDWVVASTGP